MKQIVAWSSWIDIDLPDDIAEHVTWLNKPEVDLTDDELASITLYVARYLGGDLTLGYTERMPNLRVLQLPNAGFDNALDYVRPGLLLCNARGVHDDSTAELAVALALAGRRGFAGFAADQQAGRWRHRPQPSLADSRIAVIGHGSIGRTIISFLSGFPVTIEAFSRRGTDGARPVSELPDRIGMFDIVILVLPLTAESAHLFDADLLGRMRDGALLVNVARGGIVDTEALLAELQSGRLHAALDVTDPEPLPDDHPLFHAPNCLITPHVGGNTTAFEPRMRALIAQQVTRLVRGEEPANIVVRG